MASNAGKTYRCAIYTRKSTEHGLELEFNSLDAQREACEAYIKSQTSLGWRIVSEQYDDPAFSGGNLERPALKRLLKDIEGGKIDVVVVYKIDRLTRSLADFAKLVEAFDAKEISFVAVTQQFNTTTSMGRLTLNVLLSFAQFERELSSERVRDKIAASRAKGKWTGGSVPLGYDIKDKKLVINTKEAETVRFVFKQYLALRSFGKLLADLERKRIVTKVRNCKIPKYCGGIPFRSGTLGYFLSNRIYLGETHHRGKWFAGEHAAIIDPKLFASVQRMRAAHSVQRKAKRFKTGSLLMGKLFDDRGNRMTPTFSTKAGVRHRFYASSAVLRGKKGNAGSVPRVSAPVIEGIIRHALRQTNKTAGQDISGLIDGVEKIVVGKTSLLIHFAPTAAKKAKSPLTVPWKPKEKVQYQRIDPVGRGEPDAKLMQAIIRAHAWLRDLQANRFKTVEALAASVKLHPKVVRQELRYAFLAPTITEAILNGEQPATLCLARIPKTLPLAWSEQCRQLGF